MIVVLYVKATEFPKVLEGKFVHASSSPTDMSDVEVHLDPKKAWVKPVDKLPGKFTIQNYKTS